MLETYNTSEDHRLSTPGLFHACMNSVGLLPSENLPLISGNHPAEAIFVEPITATLIIFQQDWFSTAIEYLTWIRKTSDYNVH
jgi:hypothetical protein